MTSVESSIIIIVGSVQVTSRPIYIQNITHESGYISTLCRSIATP